LSRVESWRAISLLVPLPVQAAWGDAGKRKRCAAAADDRRAVLAEHRHFAFLLPHPLQKRKPILPGEHHVQQDYDLNQYAEAEPVMLEWLSASERPARVLDDAAGGPRAGEFLGAAELAADAVGGAKAPKSLCYVYDAQGNTLTREHVERMKKLDVRVSARGRADGAELR
jgi:hypothetical protein